MKSIVFAAVFSSALVFVLGQLDSEQVEIHKKVEKKEEEVAEYCNRLYPVSEDSRLRVARMTIKGETVPEDIHAKEWCNLNCNLEKLGFFDADGTIQVRKIYEFLLEKLPEFKPNRQFLLIHLFQTYRMTKNMDEKCEKSLAAYIRFSDAVMMSTLDADFHADAGAIERVLNEVSDGKGEPEELETSLKRALTNTELFFDLTILK
ncbi:uncharacterized protein LOC135838228 [Planococcus citri]|uniref:uncharacterized protein LOC135838228 n=1 Tax=Planococcus citri TaxID=170843 RepID=UPI0031F9C947